jgi:hypothetical protein
VLQAPEVAKAAAGDRNIVNEISIQPVGAESESKDIAPDLDGAIEQYYRAALIARRQENGVLSLKGGKGERVKNPLARGEAEQISQATPNVRQLLN